MVELTHDELVEAAASWVAARYARGSSVVLTGTGSRRERPDVIAFVLGATSLVVEAKVSMSDLLADEVKDHRAAGGMGDVRWLAIPNYLEERFARSHVAARAWAGWGLVVFDGLDAARAVERRMPAARSETIESHVLRHAQERDLLVKRLIEARADAASLRRARALRTVERFGRARARE